MPHFLLEAKLLFSDNSVEPNLVFIHANYGVLSSTIMQLKSQNVSLINSITLMKSVQNKLDNVIGEVGVAINQKLTNVLQKNVGFIILQNISNILTGEITSMKGLHEDLITDDLDYFKYACITSTDVEMSFSSFKNFKYSVEQSSSVRC